MSREWVPTAIPLLAVGFLGTLAFRTLVPAIAFVVSEDLAAGVAGAAVASAAFILCRSAASLASGWLYDRARLARILPAISFAAFSIVTLLYALAREVWHIALLKGLQGLLAGLSWPLVQVVLAESVPERIRGRVLSIYFSAGSAAGLLANFVYAAASSWPVGHQLLLPAALFACAALAYLASRPPPRIPERRRVGGARPQLALVGAALAVSSLCSFAFGEVSYALLSELLSIGRAETALAIALVTAAGMGTSYLLNWAADAGFELQVLAATVAAAGVAPLAVAAGGSASLVGYVLALASQMAFRPLSRRYATTRSETPGLAVGALNAASNVGTGLGQLAIALLASVT